VIIAAHYTGQWMSKPVFHPNGDNRGFCLMLACFARVSPLELAVFLPGHEFPREIPVPKSTEFGV
jgi:hypothetical protein